VAKFKATEFYAGWIFWTILLVLLVGPSMLLMWRITEDDSHIMLRVGSGVVLAAIGAGAISWAVNGLVQWHYKKRRISDKKRTKKGKR